MIGHTIIVVVVVFAAVLHTDTRRQGQTTIGVTVEPGQIPDKAVAVIQGITRQRGTQETILGVMYI